MLSQRHFSVQKDAEIANNWYWPTDSEQSDKRSLARLDLEPNQITSVYAPLPLITLCYWYIHCVSKTRHQIFSHNLGLYGPILNLFRCHILKEILTDAVEVVWLKLTEKIVPGSVQGWAWFARCVLEAQGLKQVNQQVWLHMCEPLNRTPRSSITDTHWAVYKHSISDRLLWKNWLDNVQFSRPDLKYQESIWQRDIT